MTPASLPWSRAPGAAVLLACAAQFLSALNMGVAPLLVSPLSADLGFGAVGQSWMVSGYALAFAGFVLLGGRLTDVFGGGRMLAVGYAVAAVSALLAACSPTGTVMIGARIAQGIGAALTVPAALGIIATTHQELAARSRALAAFAGSGAVGFGLGLAFGGLAADTVGWRWLFAALGGISALLTVLTVALVERRKRSLHRVSIWGSVLSAAGLMLLAYAVTIGAKQGFQLSTLGAGLAGICVLAAFVMGQSRSRSPIMPIEIWSRPGFAVNVGSTTLLYGAWVSAYYFAALMLREVLGLSATTAALVMAPLAIGAAIGSRTASVALPRLARPSTLILIGCMMCALSIACLAIPALAQPWVVVVVLTLVVTGQAAAFVSLNVATLSVAGPDEAGLAGALFNAGCQVGGGLAVSFLAAFSQVLSGGDIAGGYRVALLGAALLALSAGLVAFLPQRRGRAKVRRQDHGFLQGTATWGIHQSEGSPDGDRRTERC
ncbi:MFS transporter [Rhodococcus sp. ACS1]|uniref:MFS transporter n=1 Tax=Rhodococcus sp. ACS1 TaxID=2028570 RepID=UPI00211B90A8|nr:MFS transporter [Rhodococcus sp. ACS1]